MTIPFRIITLCTGNICHSPMPENLLADTGTKAGLNVEVNSAWATCNIRILRSFELDVAHSTPQRQGIYVSLAHARG